MDEDAGAYGEIYLEDCKGGASGEPGNIDGLEFVGQR
jgi:hypothetical protein